MGHLKKAMGEELRKEVLSVHCWRTFFFILLLIYGWGSIFPTLFLRGMQMISLYTATGSKKLTGY
jgi:hypothetical protein